MPGAPANTEDRAWITLDDVVVAASVRRAAVRLAEEVGLSAAKIADIAIVAMEMATNAARHADQGAMLLRVRRIGDDVGIELIATDRGPGMADVTEATRDGHSTGGTLGIGLGAIARLTDDLDIYSRPGSGTVVTATLWRRRPAETSWVDGISRPIDGEQVCGDGYRARDVDGRRQIMLCDGLGHGPLASFAARAIEVEFGAAPAASPQAVLEYIHARTGHTRGGVVAVAELDFEREVLRYAGIGNVVGLVYTDGGRRSMVSLPGIVGHQRPQIREFDYALPAGATVILQSDGVTNRWSFDDYPGLTSHAPGTIAAVLLRTAGRGNDDASVLVAKSPAGGAP